MTHLGIKYTILENESGEYEIVIGNKHFTANIIDYKVAVKLAKAIIEEL